MVFCATPARRESHAWWRFWFKRDGEGMIFIFKMVADFAAIHARATLIVCAKAAVTSATLDEPDWVFKAMWLEDSEFKIREICSSKIDKECSCLYSAFSKGRFKRFYLVSIVYTPHRVIARWSSFPLRTRHPRAGATLYLVSPKDFKMWNYYHYL